jgi:hypothetical protein
MTDLITLPRATVEQVLEALEGGRESWRLIGPAIDALRAALEQPEQCSCGDRPKGKCPGEWEPGCDLGNNPAFARRASPHSRLMQTTPPTTTTQPEPK